MKRYTSRTSLTTLTELNITPLLDLAFTLLIIFMLTTPLIENRLDLIVPTSGTPNQPAAPSEILMVEVARSGQIRIGNTSMTPQLLEARLAQAKAANPEIAVVVRPDRELPMQAFINVMDILKRAAITKVGVMTRPVTDPSAQ